jgi:hypothetical protein
VTQPTVLSASSVTTFLRCGQQWFFAYVAGVKSPPALKAIRGIAVHRAVEVDMVQKLDSGVDLPVDDMLDAYDTSWETEIAEGYSGDDKPGTIKDMGYKLVKLYHKTVAPRIQPYAVELPIQFDINGRIWTGQVDLLEGVVQDDGVKLVVRDTKSTARKPAPNSYLLNMTGYAVSMRQATGQVEADTVLDYLVATNNPYYHEVRMGGPITDEQIRQFAGVVESVGESIDAGRFVPNGLVSGACSWCGYRAMCPAYREA